MRDLAFCRACCWHRRSISLFFKRRDETSTDAPEIVAISEETERGRYHEEWRWRFNEVCTVLATSVVWYQGHHEDLIDL